MTIVSRFLFALNALTLLSACTGSGGDSAPDGSADSDTASHDDTAPSQAWCGGYANYVHAGQSWTYDYPDLDATFDAWVVAATDAEATVETTRTYADGSSTTTWEYPYHYGCGAAGIFVRGYSLSYTTSDASGTRVSQLSVVNHTECPLLKAEMAAGDSWDCTLELTISSDESGDDDYVEQYHVEVADAGTVTVPAGSWPALQVAVTRDQSVTWTEDYAYEVGLVRDQLKELTSYVE